MGFIKTELEGVFIFEPKIIPDSRGHFFEAYNKLTFADAGLHFNFVQDNQSRSTYGVIRGLHYQLHPHAQTKLVRVVEGRILDVAVDIREGSPTYGKHVAVELSADNQKQLLIPVGFAHGFSVLSENATVLYKCEGFYHKASEHGIRFDDPELDIDWQVPPDKRLLSEKDLELPPLKEAKSNFAFTG